ncbi:GntR family transcriptional regulator [Pseudonocardia oceani]|uniref:GntR family transcriptional regulator n=1 Tax=Pseudonocardia oceani TaxID=2792013 RepID=UPI001C4A03D5|nr:GntR family transcriptional regulator [Pseudonocardia oceani]
MPVPAGPTGARRLRLGTTARDRVADVLRNAIVRGELAAGTRIDLDEAAAQLGTSRTPVREACLALEHEGLLTVAPRSGVTVVGLTRRDVEDNFAIMAVLSGTATAWAAERRTGEELDRVRELAAEVRRLAGDGGPDLESANFRFHRAVHRASGSVRVLALLRQSGRIVPSGFFSLVPEQVECSLREHDEIVDALAVADPDRARRTAEAHLLNAGRLLLARVGAATPVESGACPPSPG